MGLHNPLLALKRSDAYAKSAEDMAENAFIVMNTNNAFAYERIPAHLDTTFKWFKRYAVFGDFNAEINGVRVVDVLSYYPESDQDHQYLEAWRVRGIAQKEQWGWHSVNVYTFGELAAPQLYKFYAIPALAYAWSLDSSRDWYVVMNDDIVFLPSSLLSATRNHDPQLISFITNDSKSMILSNGAMFALFGNTSYTIRHEIHQSFATAVDSSNASIILEKRLLAKTENMNNPKTVSFVFDSIALQSNELVETVVRFDEWCQPVGTFQFRQVWDLRELSEWYNSLLDYAPGKREYVPTYYDFYRDFVMPHVMPEKKGWSAQTWATDAFKSEVYNKDIQTSDECRNACQFNGNCHMWSFRAQKGCELVLDGVVAGTAFNSNKRYFDNAETVAGYMPLRILEARRAAECDPVNKHSKPSRAEGWLNDDNT